MNLEEAVLAVIRRDPAGLTDQQIKACTGIQYVAKVNQLCRGLVAKGLAVRVQGPDGRLVTKPRHVEGTPEPSVSDLASPAPARLRRAPLPIDADPWQQLTRLDPAHTLIVIPCSKKKRSGGVPSIDPQFATSLPSGLAQQLKEAQTAVALRAKLQADDLLPAWQRYDGAFYREAGTALKEAVDQQTHILILSGGYGVVTATQPVGMYDRALEPRMWPSGLLQQCLAAYAARHQLTAVVAFAGTATPYARIVRNAG